MKTIVRIARTELALLFYSPIAWLLMVALLFQAGLLYTNSLKYIIISQGMGGENLKYLTFLTTRLFSSPNGGLWTQLVRNLYLYLPLLTMGLMAREFNAGTIKLLYSSPVKSREIIFGKFLAMMVFNLVLILILAIFAVSGLFNVKSADAGMLMSGLFGIYLLLCTYAAIGLFMSCLTSYQVVAALSTLLLLAFLSYSGQLWQGVDFVRDLTYFLSINGRTQTILLGLISTKDVLYFLAVTGMFLGFAIYKIQSDRESRSRWVKSGRYALIVVITFTVGYLSARPGLIAYWDLTRAKSMTLTKNGQKILGEMDDSALTVTTYVNLLDNFYYYGSPEQRNADLDRWERYLRFKPDIHLKYVYYYDSTDNAGLYKYNRGSSLKQIAEKYSKSWETDLGDFMPPAEIRRTVNLRGEGGRYVMQLSYKGKKTFLRLFDDQMVFPSETETDAALKRVMRARLPKIAFCQGEGERSIESLGDRHYKFLTNQNHFRYSLINQGFDVETLFLKDQEIPTDIAALVIADPRIPFDSTSLRKIYRYIADGGDLLIAGEPGKQAILDPVLRPLGVQMMDGMMVEKNKDFSPELVQPYLTDTAARLTKDLQENAEDSLPLAMKGVAALTYGNDGPFAATPFFMTTAGNTWNKKIKPTEDMIAMSDEATQQAHAGIIFEAGMTDKPASDAMKNDPAAQGLGYDSTQGDTKGPLPVVVGLTRNINGKQQRIVVSGDADFLSNAELGRYTLRTCNFNFSTAIFSWFTAGEYPIDTHRPPSVDTRVKVSDAGLKGLKILFMGVFPGIMLAFGSVILIRRKRK